MIWRRLKNLWELSKYTPPKVPTSKVTIQDFPVLREYLSHIKKTSATIIDLEAKDPFDVETN